MNNSAMHIANTVIIHLFYFQQTDPTHWDALRDAKVCHS